MHPTSHQDGTPPAACAGGGVSVDSSIPSRSGPRPLVPGALTTPCFL
ncbi:Uncharacterized protein ChrSV_5107 [Chromobacterium vaccinii]|nr:Uncharacterized protein ChrSW_5101 [Chromobacterium vaccinii]QND92562.1 Uncharacterized protein ChrSV_5107 [Chromobacterium vaccinii]